MADLFNTLAGLIVGLVTGFFFERRATRAAQREAHELGVRLRAVQESVYVMGGSSTTQSRSADSRSPLTEADLLAWLVRHQDGAGRVPRVRVFDHLLARGYSSTEVADVVATLSHNDAIRIIDAWIEVTQ